MYDVFITHAWRYHEDWNRFVVLLDSIDGFEWRNFSLPWYDPAFDPRTPLGLKMVSRSLEAQIAPVHCVVVLTSVFETKSARRWVDMEINIARSHGKPMIGVPNHDESVVPDELADIVTVSVSWDATNIMKEIIASAS